MFDACLIYSTKMRVDEIKTHFFRHSLCYCCFAEPSICFRNVERWAIIHLFFLVLLSRLIDHFCHSYMTFILIFETFVIFLSSIVCSAFENFAKRSCLTMRNEWEVKRGAWTISRKYSYVRIDVQQYAQPSNASMGHTKIRRKLSRKSHLIQFNFIVFFQA